MSLLPKAKGTWINYSGAGKPGKYINTFQRRQMPPFLFDLLNETVSVAMVSYGIKFLTSQH
jgi:hypothetical protein